MNPSKKTTKPKTTNKKKTVKRNNSRKNLKFFKTVSLLADLNDDEVLKIYNISKKINFKKGDVIMHEGAQGDTMYLFYEGEVEVLNTLTMKFGKGDFEETEKSMVKLNADFVSFFGEMSLLEDAPRSATITASTDCILYEIDKNNFRNLCMKNSELGYKILLKIAEVLCSRIRKNNRDVLKLTTALSIALSR